MNQLTNHHCRMSQTPANQSTCCQRVNKITAPEVFWLWAIHYWVQSQVNKSDPIPMFARAFYQTKITRNRLDHRAAEFDYSLSILMEFSNKPLSVGCPCCCGFLGKMEQTILGCMALQQQDHDSKMVAAIILKSILPELLANTLLDTFSDLAEASLVNGMKLPVRPLYLDLATNAHSSHNISPNQIEAIN